MLLIGLDDLCVRFIMNIPKDDLSTPERICFQVEEAQWYYEDFIRPLDPALPSMSLRRFCERIFAHCPLLSPFSQGAHMQAFEAFLMYKARIPVRGAIMLNEAMDQVLLVKGWKKSAAWSFPRGKINKDEDDLNCAIREVYEETGYDLDAAELVPQNRNVKYIEVNIREQQMRLFVFRNVPMDTHFEPRTRKEISKIMWWRLSDLPAFRKKGQQEVPQAAVRANNFYMVAPFLVPLRKWVVQQKQRDSKLRPGLPYPLSTNEVLTEDDQGAESTTEQGPSNGFGVLGLDSLEGATAALNRLLKIQPTSQELQAESMAASVPASKDSGQALLALLQSKPVTSNPLPQQTSLPETPFDHTIQQLSMPQTPHHIQPRLPHFSSMPPPPSFPIQQQPEPFSYQMPTPQIYHQQNAHLQQRYVQHQVTRTQANPNHNQSQHLVHPQPLPPQVQKAVFTGGPVHAPLMPQPEQKQPGPHFTSTISVAVANPQFPGLHAPMVPQVQRQSPAKLTGHHLALLNAFNSPREEARNVANVPTGPPPSKHPQEIVPVQTQPPQELPAQITQVSHPNQHRALQDGNRLQGLIPTAFGPKPISESHKNSLLGLFKSPAAQAAVPALISPRALPTTGTPSAVELSAVEPLSDGAATTSALLNDKRTPDYKEPDIAVPEPVLNPEANLPFRAMTILARPEAARPAELSNQEPMARVRSSQRPQSRTNGRKSKASPAPTSSHRSPGKAFQPQVILRRPQPGPSTLPEVSPMPQHAIPNIPLPIPDRRAGPPAEHKQDLLSLFKQKTVPGPAPQRNPTSDAFIQNQSIDPLVGTSTRSRVGSLASAEAASRRGSQTPLSPADKGFLLSYLEAQR